MATRMQQRRGTATQWTTANPILAAGEIGFESGTNKFKIGDGVNTWSALTYYASAAEIAALVDGAPDLLNTLNELAAAIGDDANFGTAIEASINTSVDEANTFTTTAVSTHRQLTQAVHGIADTSLLATTANVATAKTEALASAATAANAYTDAAASTTLTSAAADAASKVAVALTTAATDATTKADGAVTTAATDATTKANNAVTSANGYTDTSITTHNSDTTSVHGIADTSALALSATVATNLTNAITAHNDDTTNVHGIADTSLLATKVYADGKASDAQTAAIAAAATAAGSALSTHESDTTNVHGIADTSLLATTANVATAKSEAITAAGTAADTKVSTAVAALTKSSVGLANVDNTADSAKPVSTAQATAIATAKSEAIASATAQVDALLTGAPAALNTLDELAAALGDDANFASTVTTSLAAKAPLASPTFTGTVTVAASGIAFTDGTQTAEGVPSRTPIIQKTASYTLSALTERDDLIEMGSGSAMTVTIPTDATLNFPIGTSIDILQTSTGQVTIAGASGVTVNSTPGLKLRTTWSSCTLFKRAANTWVVYGDLTA